MDPGIQELLDGIPDDHEAFGGTEHPMPVSQAILGEEPDPEKLRAWLDRAAEGELKGALEPVAIAAELIESVSGDREDYYLDDQSVRGCVFSGAKWRAGWVVAAGSGVTESLVAKLKDQQYMVFSAGHTEARDRPLPDRETGAVYFLQLMVRYAMTWGQIPPGDDHEMGHFLERDMPGAMVVLGDVGPVEGLVLLAIMKLGCPAVVDSGFPYDIGPRAVADTEEGVLAALAGFPNMRVRVIGGEELTLPAPADPTHAKEEVSPARTVTGVFQLRPADCEPGVEVSGDLGADSVAIVVEVSDAKLDLPVSAHLEAQAIGYGSYLPGVRTRRDDSGEFAVELAQDVELDPGLLGEVIRAGLRRAFPRLGGVRVGLAFGAEAVRLEAARAEAFERERNEAILAESDESADEFHLCIDCQPFSHNHVCVVSPDRPPMCGRGRNTIKAGALWGTDYRPWTRRDKADEPLQLAVAKGEAIDVEAGEWTGINAASAELTDGALARVRLHSVIEFPHTSCGCFGALAFQIPGTDWIGVMHRGYEGQAPGELTWSILANRAGGKQYPGVTGINLAYLASRKALAGEGGLGQVKWATRRALEAMAAYLPAEAKVATEDDAASMDELRTFLRVG